jgi:hypothetical protein
VAGVVVSISIILAAASAPAWAQGPAPGERTKPPAQEHEDSGGSFLRNVYVEFAPEFDIGKFGAKKESSFLYLPTTLGYDQDGVVASVTVPYQVQRARVGITFIGGRPVRTGGAKAGKIKTVGGLGDTYLDGGYYFLEEHEAQPALKLEGEIKFPTADDERGLGTGAYDEALRLYSSMTFFKHLKVDATLGYGFIGQPEDVPESVNEFHNIVYFGASAGYAFNPKNELWVRFEGNTRITDRSKAYELVSFEYDHYFKGAGDPKLFFSVGFGLTNATPGLALVAGFQIWF